MENNVTAPEQNSNMMDVSSNEGNSSPREASGKFISLFT